MKTFNTKTDYHWLILTMLIMLISSRCQPTTLGQKANVTLETVSASPMPEIQATELPSPLILATSQMTLEPGVITSEEFISRWLNGLPCLAPCWQGVTPGETTAQEALDIVNADPVFLDISYMPNSNKGDYGDLSWSMKVQRGDGRVYASQAGALFRGDDQVVVAIRVSVPKTTLSRLIDAFGPPSHIYADLDNQRTPETWILQIIWINYGMLVDTVGKLPHPVEINDSVVVDGVMFFDPTIEGLAELTGSHKLTLLTPWKGYADFASYIVPSP